jgi:hypothetical protein
MKLGIDTVPLELLHFYAVLLHCLVNMKVVLTSEVGSSQFACYFYTTRSVLAIWVKIRSSTSGLSALTLHQNQRSLFTHLKRRK